MALITPAVITDTRKIGLQSGPAKKRAGWNSNGLNILEQLFLVSAIKKLTKKQLYAFFVFIFPTL